MKKLTSNVFTSRRVQESTTSPSEISTSNHQNAPTKQSMSSTKSSHALTNNRLKLGKSCTSLNLNLHLDRIYGLKGGTYELRISRTDKLYKWKSIASVGGYSVICSDSIEVKISLYRSKLASTESPFDSKEYKLVIYQVKSQDGNVVDRCVGKSNLEFGGDEFIPLLLKPELKYTSNKTIKLSDKISVKLVITASIASDSSNALSKSNVNAVSRRESRDGGGVGGLVKKISRMHSSTSSSVASSAWKGGSERASESVLDDELDDLDDLSDLLDGEDELDGKSDTKIESRSRTVSRRGGLLHVDSSLIVQNTQCEKEKIEKLSESDSNTTNADSVVKCEENADESQSINAPVQSNQTEKLSEDTFKVDNADLNEKEMVVGSKDVNETRKGILNDQKMKHKSDVGELQRANFLVNVEEKKAKDELEELEELDFGVEEKVKEKAETGELKKVGFLKSKALNLGGKMKNHEVGVDSEKVERLEKELNSMRELLEKKAKFESELRCEIVELQKRNDESERMKDEFRRENEEKLLKVEENRVRKEKEYEVEKTRVNKLVEELERKWKDEKIQKQLVENKLRDEIKRGKMEVDEQKKKLEELLLCVSEKEKEIEKLDEELKQTKDEIVLRTKEVNGIEKEMNRIREEYEVKVSVKEKEIRALNASIDTMMSENRKQIEDERINWNERVNALVVERDAAKIELETVQQQLKKGVDEKQSIAENSRVVLEMAELRDSFVELENVHRGCSDREKEFQVKEEEWKLKLKEQSNFERVCDEQRVEIEELSKKLKCLEESIAEKERKWNEERMEMMNKARGYESSELGSDCEEGIGDEERLKDVGLERELERNELEDVKRKLVKVEEEWKLKEKQYVKEIELVKSENAAINEKFMKKLSENEAHEKENEKLEAILRQFEREKRNWSRMENEMNEEIEFLNNKFTRIQKRNEQEMELMKSELIQSQNERSELFIKLNEKNVKDEQRSQVLHTRVETEQQKNSKDIQLEECIQELAQTKMQLALAHEELIVLKNQFKKH